MRTKEINGICVRMPSPMEGIAAYQFIEEKLESASGIYDKAKLIIELPEREIKLTESQFDEAVRAWMRKAEGSNGKWVDLVDTLKEKLFGADV